MAQPDISSILAALAQQQGQSTPQASATPQQLPPGASQLYQLPAQSPPVGAGYLPPPSATGSLDLSGIRPTNSGSVSIADAIAKAKSIAADRGVPSYDPRHMRSRSRSRSPARHDVSNPYRDDRRGDPRRGAGRRSPSPDNRGGNYGSDTGTEQIRVKSTLVGLIIGRNGESLRRVEGESGARVQFVQTKEPGITERQCNITGTLRAREKAKTMIYDVIDQNGGVNVMLSGSSASPPSSTMPPPREGEQTYQMHVPHKTVGLIIGKGGETIKDIQEKSGCHVNIVGENKNVNGQRPVNLIGSERAISAAKQLIMDVVDSDNGSRSGTNAVSVPRDRGYNTGGGDDSYEEKTIRVPSEAVGLIIGRSGESIKSLQRESGCKINVNQPNPPDVTRSIDLAGTRRSIEAAERVIWEKVDTVRQRDGGGGGRQGRDEQPAQSSYGGYGQNTSSGQGYGAYGQYDQQQQTTQQQPFQMPFLPQQQQQSAAPAAQPGAPQMDPAAWAQYYAQYMAHVASQQPQNGQQ